MSKHRRPERWRFAAPCESMHCQQGSQEFCVEARRFFAEVVMSCRGLILTQELFTEPIRDQALVKVPLLRF